MLRLAYLLAVAGVTSGQLILLDGVRCGQLTCQFHEYCSQETNRCASCSVACNKTHHNYDSGLCINSCQGLPTDKPEDTYLIQKKAKFCPSCGKYGIRVTGYLLDLRYMRKTESTAPAEDFQSLIVMLLGVFGKYQSVERQAETALIISGVALAALFIVLVLGCLGNFSWRYLKQKLHPAKNRVKQYPTDLTHHNPHAEMTKPKSDLKLEMGNPESSKRHQSLNIRDLETQTTHTEKSQGITTSKTISTAISNRHPAEDTTLDFSYDNMGMNVTPSEEPAANHKF